MAKVFEELSAVATPPMGLEPVTLAWIRAGGGGTGQDLLHLHPAPTGDALVASSCTTWAATGTGWGPISPSAQKFPPNPLAALTQLSRSRPALAVAPLLFIRACLGFLLSAQQQ